MLAVMSSSCTVDFQHAKPLDAGHTVALEIPDCPRKFIISFSSGLFPGLSFFLILITYICILLATVIDLLSLQASWQ
jgi:hypothetical protein